MTKDVLVSISGLQFDADQKETVEVISPGEYYFRNGKHFVLYEEISEESNEITKNVVKFSESQAEITKKGASNVHMLFEGGKNNQTYYSTPYGSLLIGINTEKVCVEESEDALKVYIHYALDMNYNHVSDCSVTIRIMPRNQEK